MTDEPQLRIPIHHAAFQAIMAPRTLFTRDGLERVRLPALVAATASAIGAAGEGLLEALRGSGFGVTSLPLDVLGQFLLTLPLVYLNAGFFHLVARWVLPGRVDFALSLAVVGCAGAPAFLAWTPLLQLATGVWMLVLVSLGFARLRNISLLRAAVAPAVAVLPIVAVLGLRTFVVEAFLVPSSAMFPTLMPGDHVFIAKSAFAFGNHVPHRGDVIVFESADGLRDAAPQLFIRRVVALPGDTVELRANDLVINGWTAPRCVLDSASPAGSAFADDAFEADDLTVSLASLGDTTFLVAHDGTTLPEGRGAYTIPPGHILALADYRGTSDDSSTKRDGAAATVDVADIVGTVSSIWLPLDRRSSLSAARPRLPAQLSHLAGALERCLQLTPPSTLPPPNR